MSNVTKKNETTWIIELQEDPETGDLVMEIPSEVLESQNWNIGDTLVWNKDQEGAWTLTKKKSE